MNESPPATDPAGAGRGVRGFTGRRRERTTSPSVKWADRVAAGLISVGGVGTILAIFGVGLVLVWQVIPLFASGELDAFEPAGAEPVAAGVTGATRPALFEIDEFATTGTVVAPDGTVAGLGPAAGVRRLSEEDPTATAAAPDGDAVALGYADGTVRLGSVRIASAFRPAESLPEAVRDLPVGDAAAVPVAAGDPAAVGAVAEATRGGRFRVQTVRAELGGAAFPAGAGPVRALDVLDTRSGLAVAAWCENSGGVLLTFRKSDERKSDEAWEPREPTPLPIPEAVDRPAGPPAFARVGARASEVIFAWPDGRAVRFDTTRRGAPELADVLRFVDQGRTLTALAWVVGRGTLLAGDDAGGLSGWFASRGTDGGGARALTRAKAYPAGPAAVAAVGPSGSDRLAAVGYADGTVRVVQTTTEAVLGEATLPGPPLALTLTSRTDRSFLYALVPGGGAGTDVRRAAFDPGAADATLASLFLPVWYEGGPGPEAKWQSTAAETGFEPKYGLWPLIFGTLKATFYSMLFAAPLALLAAIYTGEYLPKSVRAKVKPAVEVMAGLPSVVLGFLAAVAFAPYVERHLVTVLCGFVTVPVAVLAGAFAWQTLPQRVTIRRRRWRLALCAACLPVGVFAADAVAPAVEAALFAGDVKLWLDGRVGTPVGAWMFLTLPAAAAAVGFGAAYSATPRLVRTARGWPRGRFAALRAATFAGGVLLVLGLAWAAAAGLTAAGSLLTGSPLDPRGEVVDTYQQRNAVVVGFAMAFTIIPIVYTLADDALSSVPDSLRSASLGAGATVWQTTVRVVIPAAMSGLFSALMVGLGRAVGETMIVLMAAGGTAITEVNPFNGFRTLAVNIATEIPEAARGTTHYRTLFLAALLLFGMTFAVNTAAELVRLRFRKRVSQI